MRQKSRTKSRTYRQEQDNPNQDEKSKENREKKSKSVLLKESADRLHKRARILQQKHELAVIDANSQLFTSQRLYEKASNKHRHVENLVDLLSMKIKSSVAYEDGRVNKVHDRHDREHFGLKVKEDLLNSRIQRRKAK